MFSRKIVTHRYMHTKRGLCLFVAFSLIVFPVLLISGCLPPNTTARYVTEPPGGPETSQPEVDPYNPNPARSDDDPYNPNLTQPEVEPEIYELSQPDISAGNPDTTLSHVDPENQELTLPDVGPDSQGFTQPDDDPSDTGLIKPDNDPDNPGLTLPNTTSTISARPTQPGAGQGGRGALTSFSYYFGGFDMGYWYYNIFKRNGNTYITGMGHNGVELNIACMIDESVLVDIDEIIREYNIYSWNGFSKSDDNVIDGYSFKISALYDEGEVEANGYHSYPKGYDEGHKALAGYLEQLASTLGAPEITEKNEVSSILIRFYDDISVDLYFSGEYSLIQFRNKDLRKSLSFDEAGWVNIDRLVDCIMDYYARHKDEKYEWSVKGGYISIEANSEEIGVKIENTIDFSDNKKEEYKEIERLAFALFPDI